MSAAQDARRPRRRNQVVVPFPSEEVSAEVAAQLARAQATENLAKAVNGFTRRIGPAVDFVQGLDKRLDAFCHWLKRWFWPIAMSIPSVGVLIGAISPNAAKAIAEALARFQG